MDPDVRNRTKFCSGIPFYEIALTIEPEFFWSKRNLSLLLIDQEQTRERGCNMLKQAIQSNPIHARLASKEIFFTSNEKPSKEELGDMHAMFACYHHKNGNHAQRDLDWNTACELNSAYKGDYESYTSRDMNEYLASEYVVRGVSKLRIGQLDEATVAAQQAGKACPGYAPAEKLVFDIFMQEQFGQD